MNFLSDKFELSLAESKDLEHIKNIFESGHFEGGIAVQFLRNPNPIASFEKEGDKVLLLVLRDTLKNKIVGLGVCTIRRVYKKGKIVRMGYLSGLKVIPEYQKKLLSIGYIYQQLYELTKEEVDFYFTTILSENIMAQKLLEKSRKIMPLYEYLGDYRVYFCKAGIRKKSNQFKGSDSQEYNIRRCNQKELEEFFSKQARKADFSLEKLDAYDLKNSIHYGLFKNGSVLACGYVLNQQSYKQYIVKSYSGVYKILSKLPTRLFGYPSFPEIGKIANCACAGLWAENNDLELIHKLWQFIREDTKEFDFIMIGLYEKDPLKAYFEKTKYIHYDSRCYIVDWEHSKTVYRELQSKNLYIDVAFL